jgi:hypothetical protein
VLRTQGRPARRDEGFRFLRRQREAGALAEYVLTEVRCGRSLEAVLADPPVQRIVTRCPWLLDDLAVNQEIAEAGRLSEGALPRVAARTIRERRFEHHALAI